MEYRTCPDCGCEGHFDKCPNKCESQVSDTKAVMSAILIDISKKTIEKGMDAVFVPLELDGKVIGECKIENGRMAHAHIKDEGASEQLLERINSGQVSFRTKDGKTHLIGPNNDWSNCGTHPTYGNGKCGRVGDLTDCISSISCPDCRNTCRSQGGVNEWMEDEWKKQDEWKKSNDGG